MQRLFEKKLFDWKKSGMKKPLMVVGARQIGKTYTIENFAKSNFKEYLYFNLEKNSEIKELVITNTIPLPKEKELPQIKVLSIAPLFAEAIKRLNENKPMGDLFGQFM